jgi:hypothetical protein
MATLGFELFMTSILTGVVVTYGKDIGKDVADYFYKWFAKDARASVEFVEKKIGFEKEEEGIRW